MQGYTKIEHSRAAKVNVGGGGCWIRSLPSLGDELKGTLNCRSQFCSLLNLNRQNFTSVYQTHD